MHNLKGLSERDEHEGVLFVAMCILDFAFRADYFHPHTGMNGKRMRRLLISVSSLFTEYIITSILHTSAKVQQHFTTIH